MSDNLTLSPAGITEVIFETLAAGAVLGGSPEAELIEVAVRGEGAEPAQWVIDGDKARLTGGITTRATLPPGIDLTAEESLGDLRVREFDASLRIRTVNGDLRLGRTRGQVTIESAHADVRAEEVASLHITECEGDLRFSAGGDLQVERIGGDLRVSEADAVRVGRVNGDLWAEKLTGGLNVEQTSGDMRLAAVAGQVMLGQVAGDLRASGLDGGLSAGHIHGDAILEGPFPGSEGYTVRTDGDAHIRLTRDDDVRLVVRAAGRIRATLPLTPTADGTPTYSATVREGKVRMVVTSGGDLRIEATGSSGEDAHAGWDRRRSPGSDLFGDLSTLGDRIRQQVTASLAAAGINPDTGEINIGRGRSARATFKGSQPPAPPERPKAPGTAGSTTSDEQMAILKMLEEGRITPEEADSLLRALGA